MKITNIEALRTELFKNMKDIYFSGCDIRTLARTEYRQENIRPENKEGHHIRSLNDVLYIKKYHRDSETWKEITDEEMYISVREDGVWFFTNCPERQHFNYETSMDYKDYQNKMVFMMEVAVKVADFAK